MSLTIAKTVFLDASSALRWILRTSNALPNFGAWDNAGADELFPVECARTLERLLSEGELTSEQFENALVQTNDLWKSMVQIPLNHSILDAAKQRFIAPIKTLDAIHVVTAQFWMHDLQESVTLVSHDRKLNLIARSLGLKTLEQK
ncbi:MAG: type II toxin-antitoxin system VapC family toxin [Spirochaetes bacterium]|nr:type II toxin-antitoxin system VapC family toxin [Spirochaetota bacterium]